ncbi:branched-chain amino acid ABC transporter permease [Chelatococcus reniformis]|uniref:Branched-chain amino acid ABC transporter permease n=1 Tax=Chelatococcus reniformis TaxID=1494448 RepID=A0A916TZ90_9HYPH|nr:branched-chain amino acid ABC transporter permease [Chelatococcus reniformis]GGC53117.1 branched-chain amino acid ABC transporter permease [Chelatococcus reniformis]
MSVFLQQTVNGLSLGSAYAVFAVGFTLLFGVLNVLNLAQGAVFMVGAFTGLELVRLVELPLPLAFLVAMVTAGAVSVLTQVAVFGPLERRGGHRWMGLIASLAVARLLVAIAQEVFGTQVLRYPSEPWMEASWTIAGVQIQGLQLIVLATALLVMAALAVLLRATQTGRAIRTMAFNPNVARLVGVPVQRMTLLTYFIAGALAGAAGVQLGVLYNAVSPFMGETILLKGLTVLILGGLGHVPGAALAGLLLGLTEVYSVGYLSSSFRDAVGFGLVFIILLVRPHGLFGLTTRQRA